MPTSKWIFLDDRRLAGELSEGDTAQAIVSCLPLAGPPQRFGDELFLEISSLETTEEADTNQVATGTIAWWPPGPALSLFFGPTPLTPGDQEAPIITASAVVVVGRFELGGEAIDLARVSRLRIVLA